MLVLGALPSLTHAECNNPGDYIMLDFNTSLVRSNLGGQGGRCTELGACDELQTTSTPHELYFRDIAISYDKLSGSASKLEVACPREDHTALHHMVGNDGVQGASSG